MTIVKGLLLLVLIGALGAGGFYVLANRGVIPPDKVAAVNSLVKGVQTEDSGGVAQPLANLFGKPQLTPPTLGDIQSGVQTVQQVPDTSSVANNTSQVLGTSIEVKTENPPLPQRAFEYGRYTYCQEVIKDYEIRYPNP